MKGNSLQYPLNFHPDYSRLFQYQPALAPQARFQNWHDHSRIVPEISAESLPGCQTPNIRQHIICKTWCSSGTCTLVHVKHHVTATRRGHWSTKLRLCGVWGLRPLGTAPFDPPLTRPGGRICRSIRRTAAGDGDATYKELTLHPQCAQKKQKKKHFTPQPVL